MESHFREISQKHRLQPSARAWQKLEAKLDQRHNVKRLQPWTWAVAAALVLALSVLWWQRPGTNGVERLVYSPAPASLEELEATGSCEPYCLMIRHRQELPLEYRYPPVGPVPDAPN